MMYFVNSPGRVSSTHDRSRTLGSSILDLLKWIEKQTDDPSIGLKPILSSYSTWAKRSTYYSTKSRDDLIKKMVKTGRSKSTD